VYLFQRSTYEFRATAQTMLALLRSLFSDYSKPKPKVQEAASAKPRAPRFASLR